MCQRSASSNWRGGGMSAGLPRGAPAAAHADERLDLLIGQRRIVLELPDADGAIDVPRRHLPRLDALLDRARPGTRVLVGQQRHRRDRARPVAVLAGFLEDRRDVPGERHLGGAPAEPTPWPPSAPASTKRERVNSHSRPPGAIIIAPRRKERLYAFRFPRDFPDLRGITVPARPPKPKVPRAPDGHPDLQGTWDFAQLTPFERPGNFAGKSSLSDEEAEEFAQQRIETGNKDDRGGGAAADVERAYNDFWWDFGKRVAKQTSLVVDPPDGRVPALTAGGAGARRGAPRQVRQPGGASARRALRARVQLGAADDPERLQQQHAAGADARHRADPQRDDPQRAPRRAERPAASAEEHPIADRRFDRPLGRRHAGGGHDELLAGGRVPRRDREPAPGRALHARRSGHAELRVHGRRSRDVDVEVERVDPDDEDRRADLRVRVPREQLRHGRRAERRALRGSAEGENVRNENRVRTAIAC